jgi:hypothetical protein
VNIDELIEFLQDIKECGQQTILFEEYGELGVKSLDVSSLNVDENGRVAVGLEQLHWKPYDNIN